MKKYKVNTTETITYEFVIEANDFEDACANWHNKVDVQLIATDDDQKEIEDRVWETQSVKEIKE
tara:strand:+ start:289 stop:480 length:192 start_codon:yes stop_codon:yes gene_type:complete